MTTREKALLASSPGLTLLVVSLAWWALDPKGDARGHLLDRGVRLLDTVRVRARSNRSGQPRRAPWQD